MDNKDLVVSKEYLDDKVREFKKIYWEKLENKKSGFLINYGLVFSVSTIYSFIFLIPAIRGLDIDSNFLYSVAAGFGLSGIYASVSAFARYLRYRGYIQRQVEELTQCLRSEDNEGLEKLDFGEAFYFDPYKDQKSQERILH